MSTRDTSTLPVLGTVAYGVPASPYDTGTPRQPAYEIPAFPPVIEKISEFLTKTPVKLRVQAMVEADGTLRLKVHADDRLVVETSGRGTVSIESEV